MQTDEHTAPETGKDLDHYRALLWRKKWTIAAWAAAGAFLSLIVTWFLPTRYESSATIIIEDPEIPPKLIGSTVTSFAEKRLEVIDQRIMTMRNLSRIIKEFDLYPELRDDEPILTAVEQLREDFELEKVSAQVINPESGRPMSALISFTLTYRNRSPETAQKVTRELARLYLTHNYSDRRQQAVGVAEFLTEEAARLAERVDTLEDRLTQFKQQHPAFIAGQGEVLLDMIDRTETQIREVDTRISALNDQKLVLERELEIAESAASDDARSPMSLPQMRAELARISQIYAPQHPDIVLLKRRIAAAERKRKQGKTNPLLAQDVPLNATAARVRAQLATIEAETGRLKKRKDQLEEKLKELENKAMASPRLEQDYLQLRRDYESAKTQYDETKRKQLVADQARVLEKSKKAERFTLLEPPQVPREPAGPATGLIVAGGSGVFLILGLIFILVRDLIDDRIYNARQLQAATGVEPLMLVPVLRKKDGQSRRNGLREAVNPRGFWQFSGSPRGPRPAT
ncbi:MAG: GumC family protein [Alphaproteobacteria bacterium]